MIFAYILQDFLQNGRSPASTVELTDEHIGETFKKFDFDGDGYLMHDGFTQAWSHLGLTGTKDEIETAFNTCNADGDGHITYKQFQRFIRKNVTQEIIF